ncbi:hypothetical protein C6V83_05670 [Gordonia iterans]|uniref:Lipoprotein n=1 Tax=Gordonia iterans TaxID=1004901 RepID=A0A2S0KDT7_9ACTN|nr:hypothetical protein [Gordonia iterans]AVL99844.1 hypothetical protein C6V83_05670 [Gordonia iterans]
MNLSHVFSARRRALIAGCLAVGLALTLSACGAPTGKDDPETNRQTAQLILDSFVKSYNQEGLATAVDQNVCPDDRPAFDGRGTLDGSSDATGTMQAVSQVSVDGTSASAAVSVGSAGAQAQQYAVTLSKAPGVGWCVSEIVAAAHQ